GRRSRQMAIQMDARDDRRAAAQLDAGADIHQKREGNEDDQRVEAEPSVDVEAGGRGVELDARAKLGRVRRDRPIALAGETGISVEPELDREPAKHREIRRWAEVR